jgi:purine-nucleoside phosphorylase
VPTHIAADPDAFADTVLLPGDPLRARWVAETFLDDVVQVNGVRNMLGFTGRYRGAPVTVHGSGMGQPSLAIYVHEMLAELGVRTIIRVGSCGALRPDVGMRDLVLAMTASTDSSMNRLRFDGIDYAPCADFTLLRAAAELAADRGLPHHVGPIAAWDSFYSDRPELLMRLADYGVLAVEMETSTLYTLAAKHGARALTVCTVSDSLVTGEHTTATEREQTFSAMAELALDVAAQAQG